MRKNKKSSKINRREFIKRTGQASIAIAGLASGCVSTPTATRKTAADDTTSVSSGKTYEYVIVGSGAGGGPLAARLAELGHSVLLMEAGNETEQTTEQVPAYHPLSTEDNAIAWKFFVEHYRQPNRRSKSWDSKYVPGKGIFYPRASTVGGCTAHNAMITLYPDNQDWDHMATLLGDPSWNSDSMRNYWMKLERNRYMPFFYNWRTNPQRMGHDGWLATERAHISFAELKERVIDDMILSMGKIAGFTREILDLVTNINDFDPNQLSQVNNRPDQQMYMIPQATSDGQRFGVRQRIYAARKSGNLDLWTNCLATKLYFDEQNPNQVRGVWYVNAPNIYEASPLAKNANPASLTQQRVTATKEVILAGGAFNSPQLLMLSGIGDAAHLSQMGVPPPPAIGYIDLPGVGQNLQDRYELGVVSQLKSPTQFLKKCFAVSPSRTQAFNPDDPCLKDYKVDPAKSVYGSNGVVISLIKRSGPAQAVPDLVIFGVPGDFRGYSPGWSRNAYNKNMFSWLVLKGHTNNTGGTVRLRSNKFWEQPDINFNYFDDGTGDWNMDLDAVVSGLNTARAINAQSHAQNMIKSEVVPGASKTDLRDYVMKEAWGHHASCTNKMGVASDPTAVVDKDFRVFKTKGLRVVDASVFPRIPGLFIVVPIYMIAEKAAEVIHEQA